MTWFHGTVRKRFQPGDAVVPGREVDLQSNGIWNMEHPDVEGRRLTTGEVIQIGDVVWISSEASEALHWAQHATLKATGPDIRAMGAKGIAVYEVEPEGDLVPLANLHSNFEGACRRARVVREVSFEPFDLEACDNCGERATVHAADGWQYCEVCAEEEALAS